MSTSSAFVGSIQRKIHEIRETMGEEPAKEINTLSEVRAEEALMAGFMAYLSKTGLKDDSPEAVSAGAEEFCTVMKAMARNPEMFARKFMKWGGRATSKKAKRAIGKAYADK